jgi:hypothetical protein
LQPVYGKVEMTWVKPLVLSWMNSGAERAYRENAGAILMENPAPWVRDWIKDARERMGKEDLPDLAALAVGLDDPELVVDLWKETIRKGGSEWQILWWVRFGMLYEPSLAEFALQRWKEYLPKAAGGVDTDERVRPFWYYLNDYAQKLGKQELFSIKTFGDAEKWATEAFRRPEPNAPPR